MVKLTKDTDLKKLVKRRHPDYAANIYHWLFAQICYEGGRKWFDWKFDPSDWNVDEDSSHSKQNLFKFFKEGEGEYKDRKNRSHRANHTKRVVDTVNQYLFRQKPKRKKDVAHENIKNYWQNADGMNHDIDRFIREVDQWASVFGRVYIATDRQASTSNLRKDDKSPYSYIIFPQNVLDFAYDDDGALSWILLAEDYRADGIDEDGQIHTQYRLWSKKEWYLIREQDGGKGNSQAKGASKKEYVIHSEGSHDLGVVPIIPYNDQKGSKWSAPSLIQDIIYMDRTLVNYGSLLDEIMYEQTFSQLTVPAENMNPGSPEHNQMLSATKNRIFTYTSASPGSKPEFISPDASQAMVIQSAIERIKKEIYAVTGTDNDANAQSQSTGKSYASGVVRRYDQTQIENILLDKARALEVLEDRIMAMVMLWMGEDNATIDPGLVVYPDKYDIRGLETDFQIAKDMDDLEVPEKVMQQQMKIVVGKAFSRLTEEELKDFMKEVENWKPAYIVKREFDEREQDIKVFTAESQALAMAQSAEANDDLDENDDGKVSDDVAGKGIENEKLKDQKSQNLRKGKKVTAGKNISGTPKD